MCWGINIGVWLLDCILEDVISRLVFFMVGISIISFCGMFCLLFWEERRERIMGFFDVGVVIFFFGIVEVLFEFDKEMIVIGVDWELVIWLDVDVIEDIFLECLIGEIIVVIDIGWVVLCIEIIIELFLCEGVLWGFKFWILDKNGIFMLEFSGFVFVNFFLGLRGDEDKLFKLIVIFVCWLFKEEVIELDCVVFFRGFVILLE